MLITSVTLSLFAENKMLNPIKLEVDDALTKESWAKYWTPAMGFWKWEGELRTCAKLSVIQGELRQNYDANCDVAQAKFDAPQAASSELRQNYCRRAGGDRRTSQNNF